MDSEIKKKKLLDTIWLQSLSPTVYLTISISTGHFDVQVRLGQIQYSGHPTQLALFQISIHNHFHVTEESGEIVNFWLQ